MPRKAIDYSKTVIYKIQHIEKEELLYVGSTTDFIKRKSRHKSNCNNIKSIKAKVYRMMRENGGWEEFKMIEIEKFPCNDKREAEKRENEVMKELKSNMNSNRAYITKVEKKAIDKKYRENNKEKIAQKNKKYREKNKEAIAEAKKEKITCECGTIYRKSDKARHLKTKKHIKFVEIEK